ncbi:MAG: MtnX-like HAD-IB family phosphatase [Enterococcus sp.]
MKRKGYSAQYKFVIDFDGTISVNDSTTMLAEKYIPNTHRKYLEDIRAGKISVREYIKNQLEEMDITKDEYVHTLRNEMEIDLSFKNFLMKNWSFVIVSAGTLQNVYYSLKGKGINISKKRIISNQLRFDRNRAFVEFPKNYYDLNNGVDKAKVIREYQQQNFQVVFIGDSISDFEGAKVADIVYAKKDQRLIPFLKKEGIPFNEYRTFDEIVSHFQQYLDK